MQNKYHIIASELKDPIWHSLEWQIGSFSSEAMIINYSILSDYEHLRKTKNIYGYYVSLVFMSSGIFVTRIIKQLSRYISSALMCIALSSFNMS